MIDSGLYITYFLTLLALALSLFFPLKYLLQNINEAKGTFIGIAVLILIFLVGYFIAPADYTFKGMEVFALSKSTVKFVGGGLNMFYIMLVISVITTIYFEVQKFFK
jgi:hypothetical protein